ncbi:MAG: hypothetical protein F6J93_00195 [Oscillatoria sp. SIO1A7]|nr:hypothetical protein [Oscillatoria sp. SIO1A7]
MECFLSIVKNKNLRLDGRPACPFLMSACSGNGTYAESLYVGCRTAHQTLDVAIEPTICVSPGENYNNYKYRIKYIL